MRLTLVIGMGWVGPKDTVIPLALQSVPMLTVRDTEAYSPEGIEALTVIMKFPVNVGSLVCTPRLRAPAASLVRVIAL